jgi:hypothetical protein
VTLRRGLSSAALACLVILAGGFTWTSTADAAGYLSVEFNLPSDHGYRISFAGDEYGRQTDAGFIVSERGRTAFSSTSYSISRGAVVSETHVEADLGVRGSVSVDFHEQSERKIEYPSCRGYRLIKRGTFRGSFDFVGEQGFASSSGTRAVGSVVVDRIGPCGGGGGHHGGHSGGGLRSYALASCSPDSSLGYVGFGSPDGGPVEHFATMTERQGRVFILRGAITSGDADTFRVSHDLRSAVVAPAAPFAGTGSYRSHELTGDLTVSFPGVTSPLALTPAKAKLKSSSDGSISTTCGGAWVVGTGRQAGGALFPAYKREMRATMRRLPPSGA